MRPAAAAVAAGSLSCRRSNEGAPRASAYQLRRFIRRGCCGGLRETAGVRFPRALESVGKRAAGWMQV